VENKTKSLIYAFLAVLFWSTAATAFKITLRGMNNYQLLFYSSFTSLSVFYFFVRKNSRAELKNFFSAKEIKQNALLGLINPFVYYLVLFEAYRILPAQEALPINLIWPLLLSILSAFILKQKLKFKSIAGLLVSFVGVVFIATRGNLFGFRFQNLFGDLLALSSAFIWAAFWILNLIDKREESVKLFGSFFFGTIYIAIYILLFNSFVPSKINYIIGAIYIGFFEMGFTFFVWLKALTLSEDKAKTANLIYLFPVISMFFIALVLKEHLLFSSIVGLIIILSGIFIQQISKNSFFFYLSSLRNIIFNKPTGKKKD